MPIRRYERVWFAPLPLRVPGLDAAISYYEERGKGLGLDLQDKVEHGVREIRKSPESWPPHKRSGFRKYFAERFRVIDKVADAA